MNILIIDDHQLFAESLKALLQKLDTSMYVTHALNANAALEHLKSKEQPDLILLDINLPGINGFSLMNQFQKMNVWSPVLVLSAAESPSIIKTAIQNGALGFIAKSCNSHSLMTAIQTVIKGDIYIPAQNTQQDDDLSTYNDNATVFHITNRQKEILHLLAQGLVNKEIASNLGISANTVKAHLYEIFRSLGVKNRTAAVKVAIKHELIEPI